jgi:hypothetical protein
MVGGKHALAEITALVFNARQSEQTFLASF